MVHSGFPMIIIYSFVFFGDIAIQIFFPFKICKNLFSFLFERQTDRFFHCLVYSPDAHNIQGWARNSITICHMGGRDLSTWALICLPPRLHISRKLDRKQWQDSIPGTLKWGVVVPISGQWLNLLCHNVYLPQFKLGYLM